MAVFLPLSLLLKSDICRQSRRPQMHQFNLAKTHIHRPTRLQCFLLNLSSCLCLSGWLYSSLTLFIRPPRANRVIICLIVDSRRRGLSSQRATIANIVGKIHEYDTAAATPTSAVTVTRVKRKSTLKSRSQEGTEIKQIYQIPETHNRSEIK